MVLRELQFAAALLMIAVAPAASAKDKPGSQFSWPSYQFSSYYGPSILAQANEALNLFKANKGRLGLPDSIDKLHVVLADDLDARCLSPSNFAYSNIALSEVRLCKKSFVNFIEYQDMTNYAMYIDPNYVDRATLLQIYSVGLAEFFETQQSGRTMHSGPCPAAYMAMLLKLKLDPNECFIGRIPHHEEWDALFKAGLPYVDPETEFFQPLVTAMEHSANFDEKAKTALFESFKGNSSEEKIELIFRYVYSDLMRGSIGYIMLHEIGHFAARDEPRSGCAGYQAEKRAESYAYAIMTKSNDFADIPYSTTDTIVIRNYDSVFLLKDLGGIDEDALDGLDKLQFDDLPKVLRGQSLMRFAGFLEVINETPGLLKALGKLNGGDEVEKIASELAQAISQLKICK